MLIDLGAKVLTLYKGNIFILNNQLQKTNNENHKMAIDYLAMWKLLEEK